MKVLEIVNKAKGKIDEKFLDKISLIVLRSARFIKKNAKISLVFVSNSEIKKINKKYRNKDKATDVLSFPFFDLKNKKEVINEVSPFYLGEIFISYDKAKTQAKQFGFSLKREISRLLIHGILHLLGYDHYKKEERKKMENLESNIMKKILS